MIICKKKFKICHSGKFDKIFDAILLNILYVVHCSSSKPLCTLVLLFWNGLFVECSVLISCYFPSDNFQLCENPAMHSG